MKKLLSLAMALVLCLGLTVPALAVGQPGDTSIKDTLSNTCTLSSPVLYTISRSDVQKLDMSSMNVLIDGEPLNAGTFGSASEYLDEFFWPQLGTVYAVPEDTVVTLPSSVLTESVYELDITWEKGVGHATDFSLINYPGYSTVTLNGNGYIMSICLESSVGTTNSQDDGSSGASGNSGSFVDDRISFYVAEDSKAANPFGTSTQTAPATPTTPSAPSKPNFTDVAANSPFADAISWAVTKGITNGKTNTTFGPNDTCTVSHILTFLWRANGKPGAKTGEAERDSVLRWAKEQGMIANADPLPSPCTRSRAVNFMWMAAGKPTVKNSVSFVDVPNDEFAQGIAWAVGRGVTNGTSKTAFSPDKICTRGQIVTFLYRAYK